MNIENILAHRTTSIKGSAIREILKLASTPGMISLGGGLPSPDSFPLDLISTLTKKVLDKYQSKSLQYDLTEGFTPLREALIPYLETVGISANLDNIYITTGSQGFLDTLGKLLISPGDYVAVEGPTYLAALQSFNAYEAKYLQMETDDEGLLPDSLEEILKSHPVKFVYTIPTFQNPTGKTIGLERRKKIAALIREYDALLIEDDPYSTLRFSGDPLPSIKSIAPDHVIYASTFSKIFAPGLRVGYFVAPVEIGKWLVIVKQGVDLNTCTLAQALASEYLSGGYLPAQLDKIIHQYRPKCNAMLTAMDDFFPSEFKWNRPEGGMFIWAQGPKGIDIEGVLAKSVKKGVGFVPGKFFYPDPSKGNETMRLNFTAPSIDQIQIAIQTLGNILKKELNKN